MAKSVGLSVSRLQHIFRAATGETMKRYQQRLRLERASELLLSTHMSVKEVVAAVGAPDKSHFLREFKKSYGLSPRRYRMHPLHFGYEARRSGNRMAGKLSQTHGSVS